MRRPKAFEPSTNVRPPPPCFVCPPPQSSRLPSTSPSACGYSRSPQIQSPVKMPIRYAAVFEGDRRVAEYPPGVCRFSLRMRAHTHTHTVVPDTERHLSAPCQQGSKDEQGMVGQRKRQNEENTVTHAQYNRAKLTDDTQGVDVNYLATGRGTLVACVSMLLMHVPTTPSPRTPPDSHARRPRAHVVRHARQS